MLLVPCKSLMDEERVDCLLISAIAKVPNTQQYLRRGFGRTHNGDTRYHLCNYSDSRNRIAYSFYAAYDQEAVEKANRWIAKNSPQ